MTIRVASIRPVCRLAFADAGDPRAALHAYHSYLLHLIEAAAATQPRAICLPEDCMMMMQAGHAEPIDGPFITSFQQAAARHQTLLVVGLCLTDAGKRFNAVTLFDPRGHYVGRYDKTHLTRLEKERYGVTAGDRLPVFDTDLGRVGVFTCSDALFPEVPRVLALHGAKLSFFPHQMAEPDEDFFEIMIRSRAQDNCLPIVSSNFADQPGRPWFRNSIIDAAGRIIERGPLGEGYALAELDLDAPVALRDYIEPGKIDLRAIQRKYRRPSLYGDIARCDKISPQLAPKSTFRLRGGNR